MSQRLQTTLYTNKSSAKCSEQNLATFQQILFWVIYFFFYNNQLLQLLCQHCLISVSIAQVKSQTNIEQNGTVVRERDSRLKEFKVDPGPHMLSIRYYLTYKCIGFIWWFGQMRPTFIEFRAKLSHLWILKVFAKNFGSNWPRYSF